uniref:Uncharacterized protein n=1 Tax=Mola mola TaxID=94237 RepID=A0A3Q3XJ22_MOLML
MSAFPHNVLAPLPKRAALDKSSWASCLFSPSFLHYQQALANTHLQQATAAFYPTGERLNMCSSPLIFSLSMLISVLFSGAAC